VGMHVRNNMWYISTINKVLQELQRAGHLPLKLIQNKINSVKNVSYVAKNKFFDLINYPAAIDETSVNRRGWRLPRKRTRSLMFVGFFSLFTTISFFSFTVYQENTFRSNNDMIALARANVTQALESLDQYLELMADRIASYPDNDQKIAEILNTDYLNLFENKFPYILALTYHPLSNDKLYSRLGIVKQSRNTKDFLSSADPMEHIYVIEKQIEGLGEFKVDISLKHLLSSNFIPTDPKTDLNEPNGFSVKINGKNTSFHLNRSQPSFFHFLKRHANNIILLIIAAITFTFFGGCAVYYFIRRHNKVLRLQKLHLTKSQQDLQDSCDEKQDMLHKKELNLLSHKKDAKKREELLLLTISRLQFLACEGLSINSLASKLIAQDFTEPKTVLEIARMVEEANLFLKQISSGIPIKKNEAPVDLKETIQSMLGSFEEGIAAKGVIVNVNDQLQASIQTDLGMLQIILYGVLKNTLECYLGKLDIQISPAPESGVLISFSDDGHVPGPYKVTEKKNNILSLTRQEMLEITQSLGWKINWGELDGRNKTTLWLPNISQAMGKVLTLAEFRKHG
jgi:hypothetical protein